MKFVIRNSPDHFSKTMYVFMCGLFGLYYVLYLISEYARVRSEDATGGRLQESATAQPARSSLQNSSPKQTTK